MQNNTVDREEWIRQRAELLTLEKAHAYAHHPLIESLSITFAEQGRGLHFITSTFWGLAHLTVNFT